MKAKVNKTDIRFFTSADYKDAKKEYEKWIEAKKCVRPKAGNSVIGIYFDDDAEDGDGLYHTVRFNSLGDVNEDTFYSWDELSQFIHDNL